MSSLVMPSGFVDMSETEMEYGGGMSWQTQGLLAIIGVSLVVAGQGIALMAASTTELAVGTSVLLGGIQVLGQDIVAFQIESGECI